MMNIFISQPMSGLTDEEIKETRRKITGLVMDYCGEKNKEFTIIDNIVPVNEEYEKCKRPHIQYLKDDIKLLGEADLMVIADNVTEKSKGCAVEKAVADIYNIPIIYENELRSLLVQRSVRKE